MNEKLKVLIVDDSVLFRTQIREVLLSEDFIEVVGTAANGRIALEKIKRTSIDLVTLDLEMPEMGGLELLEILKHESIRPKVVVFASANQRQAEKTMQALQGGAVDFIAKPGSDTKSLGEALTQMSHELIPKLRQFQKRKPILRKEKVDGDSCQKHSFRSVLIGSFKPEIVVVASSTGGPNSLESIFKGIHSPLSTGVVIAQHMPPVFTRFFAERLKKISGLSVSEAVHGEKIEPGKIFIAPGDFHVAIGGTRSQPIILLNQKEKRNSVRPAADILFETAAEIFGHHALGIVLTGMGEDGKLGAIAIKKAGGGIFIQDERSSVVWGMPGAVHASGAFDQMGDLDSCQGVLKKLQAV